MINPQITITPQDSRYCSLSWAADSPDLESWVFINGEKRFGPLAFATAERSVPIVLPTGTSLAIEVHDVEQDTTPVPMALTQESIKIQWNPSPDAHRYRLYHRQAGGQERRVFDRPASDFSGVPIRIDCPVDLAGGWHSLRIEAVDAFGTESLRHAWSVFVHSLPEMPRSLRVSDGTEPGRFLVTVAL